MKKSISPFLKGLAAVFGLFSLLFPALVFAVPFLIEGEVAVPETCQVTDTDGVLHNFPKESSPSGLLGVCAIVAAKQIGLITEFSFIDFGFGLFLNSINGVASGENFNPSWSVYYNAELAQVGLADLALQEGDTISLIYSSFDENFNVLEEFDKLLLSISLPSEEASSVSSGGGGGGGLGETFISFSADPRNLNAANAIQFLADKQLSDGSLEHPIFTDWAAIAFAAYDPQRISAGILKEYLLKDISPGASLGPSVLSFTRRAMALMALGIDPYSGTKTNYIQKIADAFDGEQIGDPSLVNDDIFALLVLLKAGFDSSDDIINQTLQFIMSQQRADGSFVGSIDITSAALQALSLVAEADGASDAIVRAKTYLQSLQLDDGGFGNPDSTSWAMQAIAALGEDWREWEKSGKSPGEYLKSFQKEDGSVDSPIPVWSTAYAVPAALGKPWGTILGSFSKQALFPNASPFQNLEIKETEIMSETKPEDARTQELERISQELAEIKKQALLLEAKIALIASEATFAGKEEPKEQFSEEKGRLAEKDEAFLPASEDTDYTRSALGAEVGMAARKAVPYAVLGITLAIVAAGMIYGMWISRKNKQGLTHFFFKNKI